MLVLLTGNCGCLRLYNTTPAVALLVQDAPLLPASSLGIYGVVLGTQAYLVDRVFTNKAGLLTFLNTTFVTAYNLFGIFSFTRSELYYSNPEKFTNAELLMIYKNEKRCYVVGTPDNACLTGLVDAVIDLEIAPDTFVTVADIRALITDVQILDLRIEGEIKTEDNSNTLGNQSQFQNANVYVLTQQVPEVIPNLGFPYTFPISFNN